eukprot:m.25656 g.25656  ORF g.25656 m.25656 type:complete len:390 (-) comp4259_c0_seq1:2197-3366(-)
MAIQRESLCYLFDSVKCYVGNLLRSSLRLGRRSVHHTSAFDFHHIIIEHALQDHVLVRVKRTVPLRHGPVSTLIQLAVGFLDETGIVTDDNHRAFKVVNGVNERLNRLNVKVVGGFVENEHVWRSVGQVGKNNPCLLPARQVTHGNGVRVALEPIPAQVLPRILVVHVKHPPQVVDRRLGATQLVGRVLVVVTNAETMVLAHLPFGWVVVTRQELEESGLPHPIVADNGNARVHVDTKLEPSKEPLAVGRVPKPHIVDPKNRRGNLWRGREMEVDRVLLVPLQERRFRLPGRIVVIHHGFVALLSTTAALLCPIGPRLFRRLLGGLFGLARLLEFLDSFLLFLVLLLVLAAFLSGHLLKVGVVAAVVVEFLLIQMDNVCADIVKKLLVV